VSTPQDGSRFAVASGVLATMLVLAACGGPRHPSSQDGGQSVDPWIADAATTAREMLMGTPSPESISYTRDRSSVTVTLSFHSTVECRRCNTPKGHVLPHGKRLTLTLDSHTHNLLMLGIAP
jgi:hypothetical protein